MSCIIMNASYEVICAEFDRGKHHNLGFPTFKLPSSTKNILLLTCLILLFWVYYY